MSNKHSIALTALAAALALPLATGSANAAVIGSFDPGFPFVAGYPTNNLGYRGTITFDLSAGCAGASGYITSGVGGCTFTTLGATIDYYNATIYPGHPAAPQILVATTLSQAQIGANFIYGAYFDPVSGNVTAFDSGDSPNIYVSVTDTSPALAANQIHYNDATTGATPGDTSTYSDYLTLYFRSGYECRDANGYPCEVVAGRSLIDALVAPQAGPTGPLGTVFPQAYMDNTHQNGPTITSFPATVTTVTTAAAVPEPESAALGVIGLGALALARRRRKSAAERSSPSN